MTSILAAIPQPPIHDSMPKTGETVFNIFIFIPLGIMLAIAIRQLIGGKGAILLYCLIGGLFAAAMEPIVDVLGLVYMKEQGAHGAFTILDRTMPWYIVFVYPWYVGGLGYLAYRLFERGLTMRHLFVLWAAKCVIDMFLESPGLLMHTYVYYGHQPLSPWGFPFWWGFVNPVMPMAAGALIWKIRPHLGDSPWKLMAIIPLIPMADGLVNGATAWPMWIALNQTDVSYVWTYLAMFATLGLALYAVWIIGLAVARPAEELADETLWQKVKAVFTGEPAPQRAQRAERPAPSSPVGQAG